MCEMENGFSTNKSAPFSIDFSRENPAAVIITQKDSGEMDFISLMRFIP